MSGKRQFDLASVRQAIEEHGTIAAIARALECQRSTVYKYLRDYPELQTAFDKKNGGEKAMVAAADDSRTAHTKEAALLAATKSRGIKASMAAVLGCSRGTVENYLKRWPDVNEAFEASRSLLLNTAVSALFNDVTDADSKGHQAAYMFVLKTIGKDDGFVERSEVSGPDGKSLFSLPPDVLRMAEMIGFDWGAVGAQLARMITMQAEQKGLIDAGR